MQILMGAGYLLMGYFKTIFQNTGTAIVIIDKDSKIFMANSIFEKVSGYSIDELRGKSFIQFLVPEYVDVVLENHHRRQLDPDHTPAKYEVKCIAKHGQVRDVIVTAALLPDSKTVVSLLDITERNKAEIAVKRQVESQNLLLKISQDFTKVLAEDIDELINLTLKKIGEFDNDDRCYVFLFSDDGSTMSNTHEWCREGIKAEIDNLQDIPVDIPQWWMKKLRKLENINIPRVTELPPEAQAEKEILQAQEIQSLVVVPITYESSLIGYLGFDSVRLEKSWPEDRISLLNVVANIFANALQRKKHILALRESENHYRTIFENTGAATLIIEEDMTISKANREWERLFGYTREDLIGKKWTNLVTDDFVETMEEYHYLRRIDPARVPTRYKTCIKDKAGKVRDCLVFVDIIQGTTRSVAAFIDLSEYNRINRALKATSAVNMTLLHAKNEQSLLEKVCRSIVDIGGYRFAWVGYVENDAEQTVRPVAYAGYEEGYLKTVNITLTDTEMENGPIVMAIRTRQPFICRNIETDPMFVPWREEALKRGYKAVIAIPLDINRGGAWGSLTIYSEREDVFDKEEVKLLTEMAGNLAYGINSLRTRIARNRNARELEISLEKMHRLLLDTVDCLAASLEIRDPYTAGHQKRVAMLAGEIAKEMGLSADQIEGISVAGTIHDIGKIAIPSEILCKSGKISEVEFMLIKSHSQVGYDMIKNIEFPWPVGEIILQHHERMDGSGYPQGLKGEGILLAARIIAVSDVVEAMSSHRPYRPALGLDNALEEISRNKGILYDSDVVDACLNLFINKEFALS